MISRDVKFLEGKSWSEQENDIVDMKISYLQINEQLEDTGQDILRLLRLQVHRQEVQPKNSSSSHSG